MLIIKDVVRFCNLVTLWTLENNYYRSHKVTSQGKAQTEAFRLRCLQTCGIILL